MQTAELLAAVVAFRRPVYERLFLEFAPKLPRASTAG
jgi:hypothetical protein